MIERQSQTGEWAGMYGGRLDISVTDEETGKRFITSCYTFDGTFAVSVPITGSAAVKVDYTDKLSDGSSYGYLPSSATGRLNAYHRTEITGFTSPSPVGKGATATFTGKVARPAATGAAAAVAGGSVDLRFSADGKTWSTKASGRTDQQGLFKIPAKVTADGQWQAVYTGSSDNESRFTPDLTVAGPAAKVDVRYRTAVSSFNASPEPVSKGRPLTVTGVVKRSLDGSTWKTWSGQVVYVYFKARGATSWSYAGTVKSDAYGKFRRSFTASKDGTWKAVYKGNADYLRADSATDYVDVR